MLDIKCKKKLEHSFSNNKNLLLLHAENENTYFLKKTVGSYFEKKEPTFQIPLKLENQNLFCR